MTQSRDSRTSVIKEKRVVLLDLLDRILEKGVILDGEITISVADVDLVFVGLKLLLGSVDTIEKMRDAAYGSLTMEH